jgi:hypothetical protein
MWAALGVLGGFGLAAIGDMVSEEVRDRLDHLPHAILRLAARRLDPAQRAAVYDDEWMPELTYILKGDEARPVTRLYHGVQFALGILIAVRRIERELPQPARGAATERAVAMFFWLYKPRTPHEINKEAIKRGWVRVEGTTLSIGSPPTYEVRRHAHYRRTRR